MRSARRALAGSLSLLLLLACQETVAPAGDGPAPPVVQVELAGEVESRGVILQSRLITGSRGPKGDIVGAPGIARFEVSDDPDFGQPLRTAWLEAREDRDYVIKAKVGGLDPGTLYHYRVVSGSARETVKPGPTRLFRTLPGASASVPVSFVAITCMNYELFQHGRKGFFGLVMGLLGGGTGRAYDGPDKDRGYPGLETILGLQPDFVISNGDNVYYDHGAVPGTDAPTMRRKWHELFYQPRFAELAAQVPFYWTKDDHDFRFDDADLSGGRPPSAELGIAVFREQVPVVEPSVHGLPTYRTHRVSRELQIWLLEGRDYRSPNHVDDGPQKTLWGREQRAWLERTLLQSDAVFKLLISPTPLVGPDDRRKSDNHANLGGFRHEGESFLSWAQAQGLIDQGLFGITGDRHWQYHSRHPTGFEEFSSGALNDASARPGVRPGSWFSSDPQARVEQIYLQTPPTGGFIHVSVEPPSEEAPAELELQILDEWGALLHSAILTAGS
jgi:alkaline phosphatase/alkaline phosphatase D